MALISKRFYKTIKLILISRQGEQIALFLRVFFLLILVYYNSLTDLQSQRQSLIINQDNAQRKAMLFQEYFATQKTNSSINAILTTIRDRFWDLFVITSDEQRLMGAFRIVQYTVELPSDCKYDEYGSFSTISEQQIFLNSLISNCNPYNIDALSAMLPNHLEYINTQFCVEALCSEFKLDNIYKNQFIGIIKQSTPNQVYSSSFGYFPYKAFIANIRFYTENDLQTQIDKLINNGWLTNQTVAIAVQYNHFNQKTQTILLNTLLVQIQYQQEQLMESQIHQVNTQPAYSMVWYTLIILMLMSNFFFILKIIFEGSVDPKPTQVVIFLNCLIEILFIVISFMEQAVFQSDIVAETIDINCKVEFNDWSKYGYLENILPCHNYIIMDSVYQIQQVRLILLGITLIFLPFNLFWSFSYLKGTELIIKYVNLVYRTTIHFMKLMILRSANFFTLGAAFYIAFRQNFSIYSTYPSSLFAMLVWSLPTEEDSWERGASNTGLYSNALCICLFAIVRVYIFLTIVSFTSIAVQAASDFEFDFRSPSQMSNIDNVSHNLKQLEKFQKAYLNENEQKKLEDSKIVAWLSQSVFPEEMGAEIENQCNLNGVKLQSLSCIGDLVQFLNFLFQIKPQLLFKSQVYFRIIVDLGNYEILQTGYLRSQERETEHINLARLFFMLKDKGSRVPLLLNYSSKNRPQDNVIISFYKIYPYIHLNNNNFEMMKEFILSPDVKQWQKRVYITDDENADFEEEESDVNQIN